MTTKRGMPLYLPLLVQKWLYKAVYDSFSEGVETVVLVA